MINVYDFYNDVLDRINKEENGYLRADQFNRLLRFSSNDLQKRMVTGLQDINQTDKHQYFLDVLHPFNKIQLIPVDATGFVAAPEDYEHFAALRARYDDAESYRELIRLNGLLCEAEDDPTIEVALINRQIAAIQANARYADVTVYPADKLAKRLDTKIRAKRPSATKPIAEYASKGFNIYPTDTATALLVYYRTPVVAKLVMKIDNATNNEVYDDQASKDIEWGVKAANDLLQRIVEDFSIYIRERELFEMMEAQQTKK